MVESALLLGMEGHHDREDRIAMLNRGDAARRIAFAVTQPFDLVDDRNLRIARQDEIAMQRMGQPALDGAACRDHCLSDHLAAKYALPARLRAVAAEQIHLERLNIEDGDEIDQAFGHGRLLSHCCHSGARNSASPESRAENLWIPGSRSRAPGMTNEGRPLFHLTVSPSYSLLARPRVSQEFGYVRTG